MCAAQGGDLSQIVFTKDRFEIKAATSGYLGFYDVEKIGLAGIVLRAGRRVSSDILNLSAGVEFHKQLGDAVQTNDIIYTIHSDEPKLFEAAEKMLAASYQITLQKPAAHVLIKEVLN